MADISLEKETRKIYREQIDDLIQKDDKFKDLGPVELEAVVKAFEFLMEQGVEKVRAQMLYEMIDKDANKED